MMAKVKIQMYLDVSRCILMYMNGTHQDTCEIHARYMRDTWDTYPDNKPPPNSITNPTSPYRRASRRRARAQERLRSLTYQKLEELLWSGVIGRGAMILASPQRHSVSLSKKPASPVLLCDAKKWGRRRIGRPPQTAKSAQREVELAYAEAE